MAHTLLQRTHTSHAKFPARQYADVVRLRTAHRVIPSFARDTRRRRDRNHALQGGL
ncbi:hypothetical protein BURCENBC7_AP3540 [Burkholderia cenocepacia BC7]|nr:hypothetical protein BURCENK562V_C2757 [Burkholderia cenocepacia K56-2Valvano]ERI28738.1 hypothetical protein BURCENBC7_AP3540 [Burkholderia cenocepacia BC7]